MTIVGYQARMARAALGLSRDDVAKDSGVSIAALQGFENGKRKPHERTVRDIRHVLEEQGAEFVERGVRLTQKAHKRIAQVG